MTSPQPMASHSKPIIWIAAGGTGGHVFPALELARALIGRGYSIRFLTDRRGLSYQHHAPAGCVLEFLPSAPLRLMTLWQVVQGVCCALMRLLRARPKAVIGFGGYPSVPPVLAAQLMGIPTILHESNAVMGLANRVLAPLARRIAVSFPETPTRFSAKTRCTGNPVREAVRVLADRPYVAPLDNNPVHLLIIGGSLGAQRVSMTSAHALCALPVEAQKRLVVVQQIRTQDETAILPLYQDFHGEIITAPFFDDFPERLAWAHLVIARAGGSTVAELATAGRPAILIPYGGHSDAQQLVNATALASRGAAQIMDEKTLDTAGLASTIHDLMTRPARLAQMAQKATSLSSAEASMRLADCLESLITKR